MNKLNFTVAQIDTDVFLHTDKDTNVALVVYLCHCKNNCQLSEIPDKCSVQMTQHRRKKIKWENILSKTEAGHTEKAEVPGSQREINNTSVAQSILITTRLLVQ